VLDHVQRRRFLVQPAGEDPRRLPVRALHVDLDERAGQLLFLPRRGRLAGAQPNQHVLPPHRLARVKRDILHQSVALVEDAQHRDPLGHGRHSGLIGAGRHRGVGDHRTRVILLLGLAAARGERQRDRQRGRAPDHGYSGIHGS
jgi:hypothetical protein